MSKKSFEQYSKNLLDNMSTSYELTPDDTVTDYPTGEYSLAKEKWISFQKQIGDLHEQNRAIFQKVYNEFMSKCVDEVSEFTEDDFINLKNRHYDK